LSKSLISTSNRVISAWSNIFPDPITANQSLNRIALNTHLVTIKGELFRMQNRRIKNDKRNNGTRITRIELINTDKKINLSQSVS
jgi:hypothetical protein